MMIKDSDWDIQLAPLVQDIVTDKRNRGLNKQEGVDRHTFPEDMKGEIAKGMWNESEFTYGLEYGVLIALRKIFKIEREDLRVNKKGKVGNEMNIEKEAT